LFLATEKKELDLPRAHYCRQLQTSSGETGTISNEKPKSAKHFSSRTQAIEFLCGKIVSQLKANLPEEQGDTVYLEVWEREVASHEDLTILETGRGGSDTSIRKTRRKNLRRSHANSS